MAWTSGNTGCEYAGYWREAFGLPGRTRQRNNEVTFSIVIGACANAPSKIEKMKKMVPAVQRKALQLLNVLKKDETVRNPNIQGLVNYLLLIERSVAQSPKRGSVTYPCSLILP